MTSQPLPLRDRLVLVLYVLVALAVNLTKAVHIDDTAYLEMAQAILRDPWHPLSSQVNWGDTLEPIFNLNQPPLVPYGYAALMTIFGPSEWVLHLFIGACATLAILFFHWLAVRLEIAHPLYVTGLFALGPAFLPGQNLMVDVPLLALWLIFFWALVIADRTDGRHRAYLVAAVAVSAACLTKYTSLVLLPVFAIAIIQRGRWRDLGYLAIPVGSLVAWSVFNISDYGAIHIGGRPVPLMSASEMLFRWVSWISGIGAVSPFVISFFSGKTRRRVWLAVLLGLFGALSVGAYLLVRGLTPFLGYWVGFAGIGSLLLGFVVLGLADEALAARRSGNRTTFGRTLILASWMVATTLFVIFLAPFVAVRHIALVMPAVLLVLGRQLTRTGIVATREMIAGGLTVLVGVTLAVSDYDSAGIYRDAAQRIRGELPADARVYQAGHWGWQWYAVRAGMVQYDRERTQLANGDFLVVPSFVHSQRIAAADTLRLHEMRRLAIDGPSLTWLRTMYTDADGGGYYGFAFPSKTPWRFSNAPYEFVIFKVED